MRLAFHEDDGSGGHVLGFSSATVPRNKWELAIPGAAKVVSPTRW
jgi:hypothetical protein